MDRRRVTLWGDIVGRFVVVESGPDGRLVLEPDPEHASAHEPSFGSRIEQAASQGPAALDALITATPLTDEQRSELMLVAAQSELVRGAMGPLVRVEHRPSRTTTEPP